MITNSEARKIINDHIKLFLVANPILLQWTNELGFSPPDELWCRATVQYSDTFGAGLYKGQLERDYGIINIQCFAPLGWGDLNLIELTDKLRNHWKGFVHSFLEVERTHAPTEPTAMTEVGKEYVMSLLRIEFRVN